MKAKNKLIIFFTILAGFVMVFITVIAHPTVKEENVKSTTVTLGSYRMLRSDLFPGATDQHPYTV